MQCSQQFLFEWIIQNNSNLIFDIHSVDFVVNVDSINIFKSRLDKYWINQDIVFDYTADLTGTGDRSEYK